METETDDNDTLLRFFIPNNADSIITLFEMVRPSSKSFIK